MRCKQLSFLPRSSVEHGGAVRAGKRKIARAIDSRRPLHLVLRSSFARGEWSMLHPKKRHHVDQMAHAVARRHGIRIYRYSNVGNHLHLLVMTPSRRAFRGFLREVAGSIARLVTGAKKGCPVTRSPDTQDPKKSRIFWDRLAYTRIVSWGRDLKTLEQYFIKNLFEAAGLLTRRAKAAGLRVIPIIGWSAPP